MTNSDDHPLDGLVGRRSDFLTHLAETATDKRGLVAALDYSRSTVDRAVRDLLDAGLVTQTGGKYRTTPLGEVAVARHRRHRQTLETIRAASVLLDRLQPGETPPDSLFVDATVTREHGFARLARLLRDAHQCRCLLSTLPDTRLLRLLHARVVDGDLTAAVIVSDRLAERLRREFPELTAGLLAAENCRLKRGTPPAYGVVVTGESKGTTGQLPSAPGAGGPSTAGLPPHHGAGGESVAAVFVADPPESITVVESADATAVGDLARLYTSVADGAGVVADPPSASGPTGTGLRLADADRSLAIAGVAEIPGVGSMQQPPRDPQTAWRRGLELSDVYYGYAVPRPAPDDAESVADTLVESARSGENSVVLGPPGTGKSTICRRAACLWLGREYGSVFHRPTRVAADLSAVVERARDAPDHSLIVVEDAAEAAFLRLCTTLCDESDVSIVGEARRTDWTHLTAENRSTPLYETAERLQTVRVPSLDEETCASIVETFETVTDRSVPLTGADLFETVVSAGAAGEMLVAAHTVVSHAVDDVSADDPVGVSALEADVRDAYTTVADAGPLASTLGVFTAVLGIAGEPVTRARLHVLATERVPGDDLTRPADDDSVTHEAIDAAIDAIEGHLVSTHHSDHTFRTRHSQWLVRFLECALDVDEEQTVTRFEWAVSTLVAVVDRPDRYETVADWLGDDELKLEPLTEAASVDEFLTDLFAVGLDHASLAPLFGTTADSGIELPDACDPATELECRSSRGKMWYDYGAPERGERELRDLCERCTTIDAPSDTRTEYRAEGYRGLGEVLIDRGDTAGATAALDASLQAADDGDHPRHVVNALNSLAWVAMTRDAHREAACHLRAAVERAADLDPCGPVSDTLYYRAKVARARGELQTAAERLTDVIALDRELGNRQNQSSSEKLAGDIAAKRGNVSDARDHYRRSLALKRDVRDRSGMAAVLLQLGRLATREDDYTTAEQVLERSLSIGRTMEMQPHVADVHDAFGTLALARGETADAREHFETCRTLGRESEDHRAVATATLGLGDAARVSGDTPTARRRYRQALATLYELDAVSDGLDALVALIRVCREVGDERAAQNWRELGTEWIRETSSGASVDEFERRLACAEATTAR